MLIWILHVFLEATSKIIIKKFFEPGNLSSSHVILGLQNKLFWNSTCNSTEIKLNLIFFHCSGRLNYLVNSLLEIFSCTVHMLSFSEVVTWYYLVLYKYSDHWLTGADNLHFRWIPDLLKWRTCNLLDHLLLTIYC